MTVAAEDKERLAGGFFNQSERRSHGLVSTLLAWLFAYLAVLTVRVVLAGYQS